jgi:hypothetical protein
MRLNAPVDTTRLREMAPVLGLGTIALGLTTAVAATVYLRRSGR